SVKAQNIAPRGPYLGWRSSPARSDRSVDYHAIMVEVSAEIYKYWQIDYQRNILRIVYQDGRRVEQALDGKYVADKVHVATSIFDWEKWWVVSQTLKGHLVTAEGFNPNSPPPRGGRPSVYLDQNRWSEI